MLEMDEDQLDRLCEKLGSVETRRGKEGRLTGLVTSYVDSVL
jgi:hypothetical protein